MFNWEWAYFYFDTPDRWVVVALVLRQLYVHVLMLELVEDHGIVYYRSGILYYDSFQFMFIFFFFVLWLCIWWLFIIFFLEQLWILKVLQMEINNDSSIIVIFFWDAYILEGRWYYFFSSKSKNSFGTKYVCVTVWMCIFIVVIDGRYWMKINDFLFGAVLTGKC